MSFPLSANEKLAAVRQALGTPWYDEDGILLFKGDCRKLMAQMPRGIFDLTVTSPPYNIGKEYETVLALDEYIDWTKEWVEAVFDCTSDDGAFWLNVGYIAMPGQAKAIPLPYLLWKIIPFYLVQEVVWNYGAGVATKYSFSPRNEKLLWYVKNPDQYTFNLDAVRDPNVKYPNQKKNGKLKCNPLGKNPTDVWQIPKVTSGRDRMSPERTAHPAQFPAAMIERIILACSNRSDIVFDPFIGSGTTAEIASKLGRFVVGCEVREDYCEIAVNRIRAARNQSTVPTHPQLFPELQAV